MKLKSCVNYLRIIADEDKQKIKYTPIESGCILRIDVFKHKIELDSSELSSQQVIDYFNNQFELLGIKHLKMGL